MRDVSDITEEILLNILQPRGKGASKGASQKDTLMIRKCYENDTKVDTKEREFMRVRTEFNSEAERVAYHLFIQATDGTEDPEDHPGALLVLQRAYELGVEHTLTSVNNH